MAYNGSTKSNGDLLWGAVPAPVYPSPFLSDIGVHPFDWNLGDGNVEMDINHPTVPGTPTQTAVTDSTLAIAWTASTEPDDGVGLASYNIYNEGTLVTNVASTVLAHTLTGLTPSTAFSVQVTAVDNAGFETAKSSALTGSTSADTTAPSAPTLSSTGHTSTTVSLSWTAATDDVHVAGYNVYNGGVQFGSTISAPTLTATVTGLTTATPYTFTVKAVDEAANLSVASNSVVVTTS